MSKQETFGDRLRKFAIEKFRSINKLVEISGIAQPLLSGLKVCGTNFLTN